MIKQFGFFVVSKMLINVFGVCVLLIDVDITDGDTGGFVDNNTYTSHNSLQHTRQVTRATHVRNRVCPRVESILS